MIITQTGSKIAFGSFLCTERFQTKFMNDLRAIDKDTGEEILHTFSNIRVAASEKGIKGKLLIDADANDIFVSIDGTEKYRGTVEGLNKIDPSVKPPKTYADEIIDAVNPRYNARYRVSVDNAGQNYNLYWSIMNKK